MLTSLCNLTVHCLVNSRRTGVEGLLKLNLQTSLHAFTRIIQRFFFVWLRRVIFSADGMRRHIGIKIKTKSSGVWHFFGWLYLPWRKSVPSWTWTTVLGVCSRLMKCTLNIMCFTLRITGITWHLTALIGKYFRWYSNTCKKTDSAILFGWRAGFQYLVVFLILSRD